MRVARELARFALGERMAQQALGRHDDERLAERTQHLAAQYVEVIRRAGDVADLDIVVRAQLEEAFETRGAVFRPLAFITVRQKHHEPVGAQPLDLAAGDELIDHDLRAIGEIAELRFPHRQRLGVRHGKAVFEAEHAVFGQDAVIDFELAVRQRGEGDVFVLVLLIDPDGVALAKGAAP